MKKMQTILCLTVISIPILLIAGLVLSFFAGPRIDSVMTPKVLALIEAGSKSKAREQVLAEIERAKKTADSLHVKEPVFSQEKIDSLVAQKAEVMVAEVRRSMEKNKIESFFKKNKRAIIEYVLSDKCLWMPILEEIEIKSAVQAGIEKFKTADEGYKKMIRDSCLIHGFDPDLGLALVAVESQFYPKAKSTKGAKGLWQNMPTSAEHTCKRLGVKFPKDSRRVDSLLNDPCFSTFLGLAHLAESRDSLGYEMPECLVAYEAGNGGVRRQIKNYGSAKNVPYYRKVYGIYEEIKAMKNETVPLDMPPAPEIVLGYE